MDTGRPAPDSNVDPEGTYRTALRGAANTPADLTTKTYSGGPDLAENKFNFTERDLDQWMTETLKGYREDPASIPANGETLARDQGGKNTVPGLILRLRLRKERGSGQFTTEAPRADFYLAKKINRDFRQRHVGDRAVYSVEMARAEALKILRELEKGIDRNEERRKEEATAKARELTYREALEAFLEQADIAPRTKAKYRLSLTTTFRALADKPLVAAFTPATVQAVHKARSLESPSRADQDFRVLRLVWNWAKENYQTPDGSPLLGANPVPLALNRTRKAGGTKPKWNNVARRQTIIPEDRLPDWFRALYALRAEAQAQSLDLGVPACDLLEALVLTGLRFGELASLTWERVDLALGTIAIPGPVSKNRRPLVRTLTTRLREILEERHKAALALLKEGEELGSVLVFPGRLPGVLICDPPRKHLDLIAERTGLRIVPHDLRRVWASAALRAGVPQEVIKRLLNHETGTHEVTAGYQVLDRGYLRQQSQRVEDEIRGAAGLLPAGGMEAEVLALLSGMSEDEKRRLIFKLSADKAGQVREAARA